MALMLFVLIAAYLMMKPDSANEPVSAATATVLQNDPINPLDTSQQVQSAEQEVQQIVRVDLQTGKVVASAAAVGSAAAAGLAGSTTFLALSAGAWTGIGAAIAGLIAVVFALRSDTHLYANELVQKYENPFGHYVIQIIEHETSDFNNHVLTRGDATAMFQAVNSTWNDYQNVMHQFMSRSTNWLIVAKQSLNNLDNQYKDEVLPNGKRLGLGMDGLYPNGFMTSWLQWMQDRIGDAV